MWEAIPTGSVPCEHMLIKCVSWIKKTEPIWTHGKLSSVVHTEPWPVRTVPQEVSGQHLFYHFWNFPVIIIHFIKWQDRKTRPDLPELWMQSTMVSEGRNCIPSRSPSGVTCTWCHSYIEVCRVVGGPPLPVTVHRLTGLIAGHRLSCSCPGSPKRCEEAILFNHIFDSSCCFVSDKLGIWPLPLPHTPLQYHSSNLCQSS